MKTRINGVAVALLASVALLLGGCSIGTAPDAADGSSSEQPEGSQAGPGTEASTIPDEVTLEMLKQQCESIKSDQAYLPGLPGVTADGLGGKPLAGADADLAEVQRGVANGLMADFVSGGPVARAYVAEADRAFTLGDLSPTANGNFGRMIEDLSDDATAKEVCDRVAALYAGALIGEYQTIAPGTVFAGLVYSNDFKSLGYVCDLVSPPQGVRVLSWTRPLNAEFQGDQAETLPTVKVAVGYRMLVVDKCPVSDQEAAQFGGTLLDKPAPQETEQSQQPAGAESQNNTSDSGNGSTSGATGDTAGSSDNTGGGGGSGAVSTGGTTGNTSGSQCGASCGGTGGGSGAGNTGGNTGGTGGGCGGTCGTGGGGSGTGGNTGGNGSGGCSTGCGTGGGGTPTPQPTPTHTSTPTPTPPPPTPPPTHTPPPPDECTVYPIPNWCKSNPGSTTAPSPGATDIDPGAGNL